MGKDRSRYMWKNQQQIDDNKIFNSKKILTYAAFTVIFIATSVLSLMFIYHIFTGKTSFLTLKMFSSGLLFKLGVLLIIYYLLDSLRLFYILKTLDVHISFRYIIKLAFVNIFISNITPFATGGGFAQIYFLNRKGVSLGDATAATTIRTAIAIIFFFIATPIIILLDKSMISVFSGNFSLFYAFILLFVYLGMAYAIYRLIKDSSIIKRAIYKLLLFLQHKKILSKKSYSVMLKKTFKEYDGFIINIRRFLSKDKKYVFLSIAFTILFLLSLFMFSVVLIKGFNYNISIFSIIAIQIIITFITYFAPTPGATGIAEGGFALMFSAYVKRSDILVLTFGWRFFTIYIGMLIGMIIFYLEIMKRSIKKAIYT